MPGRNIVVVGGSSGAIEALRVVLAALPRSLPASIFVAIHTSPGGAGLLDLVLARVTALEVAYATDGEPIRNGRIYLARPDRHLLIKRDRVRVTRGPRENRFRPAIDPLFRTAAAAHGGRVIGVVLSGGQDDGAVGLGLIRGRGGAAVVQDPAEALAPSMPHAALRQVPDALVLPIAGIAPELVRLLHQRVPGIEDTMSEPDRRDVAETGAHDIHEAGSASPPSPFTCPECGGALWGSSEGEIPQFRCHVGHRFSGDSLAAAQSESVEVALWTALRALEESAELRRRMAARTRERGLAAIAEGYEEDARDSEARAAAIRRVLTATARADAVATGVD